MIRRADVLAGGGSDDLEHHERDTSPLAVGLLMWGW